MISNLKDILLPAREQGYAVACFNVFGFEDSRAVIDAAESRNASVILSINLDMREFMTMDQIIGMLKPMAESTKVPVCLHLDHTYEVDVVKQAIDTGFTSVMFDGSQLPISENISCVRDVVMYAKSKGVSVEAEVGSVPYATGRDHIKSALTEVSEAVAMENEGKPDALAISIGNVHRLETGSVEINIERFNELEKALSIPLVIHGTSGIVDKDIRLLSERDVAKFNVGTVLRKRFGSSLRSTLESNPELFDRLSIMQKVIPDLKETATKVIKLLGQ
ncbi:MAG: class II fructose-bisphosphate aldolase family protein [Thiotrichales bacterium]|jgi:fructose-bisphosphate aldolase class II|nr:class II fructose-bisphosphate aldolase family protein [Thiotrichales bacterium]MBT4654055.1 class II fructose-bisphosphate aldolase family protein [Thiotrichales bacterium]MBT5500430.1 class II fructose-bisphosphate aldolase family protein [Thiotrichales bacterium]MBT5984320.1 class II fructose-bisphosphate aldolase family protein [Thiotrichales bacterium]MBT6770985.1 class II fructose-bisphosphate aldolase family protein [Thiotrichales bacterium]